MTFDLETRFRLLETEVEEAQASFARDVATGLGKRPKQLSCHHLYDREGSLLFEAICELPEYYLTRAERQILQTRGAAIAGLFSGPVTLVELGSGSAAKTRLLIDSLLERQESLLFAPIDISRAMLEESSLELLRDRPRLEVLGVAARYEEGLARLEEEVAGPKLVLWLGSSVGNFRPDQAVAFLRRLHRVMGPEDRLLMGADLRKNVEVLLPAYDDAQGVTARFNLNLLARINRELGGEFDLTRFDHRALFNDEEGRVEMHLVSRQAQTVPIAQLGLEIPFTAGEAIHTENSHKYRPAEIDALLGRAGFALEQRYHDDGRRFTLNLARAQGS